MDLRMMLATTQRVLDQLRHDHRSIALILVVPALLLTAVYFLYENETLPPGVPRTFDRVGLMMLAIFPFVVMFLVTSITMLRERTSGTLERLLTTPVHKADLLFGYGLAFSIMAALQSLVATAVAYWIFDLDIQGSRPASGPDRRDQRGPGRGAGAAVFSVRKDRVPGSAVHARGGGAADPAVRAVRGPGPDERGP